MNYNGLENNEIKQKLFSKNVKKEIFNFKTSLTLFDSISFHNQNK